MPFLGLALGHPDLVEERAGVKPRIPQDALLHWDTYDADAATTIADYEDILATYFSHYGKSSSWRQQQASRVSAEQVEHG